MILTEDKTYTISLEQEDCGSTTGLVNKNTELVFSNKELLHAVVTCGNAYPENGQLLFYQKRSWSLPIKCFLWRLLLTQRGTV